MREIPLTKGQVALVDDEDFARLSTFRWHAHWSKFTKSFYARRTSSRVDGKQHTILMHREVLGLERGDPRFVDHRETGCTLDNQRSNLRISTRRENNRNSRVRLDSLTGIKCVTYHRRRNKYEGYLKIDGLIKSLGYRDTAAEARSLVLEAAVQNYGDFARV